MRLTDIHNGMRLTLFSGLGAEQKPMIVTVLGRRYVKSNSTVRKRQIRVLVKPCNGSSRKLVVPRQLQPAHVYDDVRNALALSKRRRERLEEQRKEVFQALMRRGVVPYRAELGNDGHVFNLQLNSRDLVKLRNLLRGHDGTDTQGSEQERQGEDERQGEGTEGTGEAGASEGGTTAQLPGEVRSIAAGGR